MLRTSLMLMLCLFSSTACNKQATSAPDLSANESFASTSQTTGQRSENEQHGADNAVILLYHHVSEDTPPSTSVSPQTFAEHMQYLAENHNVMPLPEIINKLRKKQPLPDKTVAITFDDGYQNILQNGHPILRKHQFPYTVFVNPALIGKQASQLSWQELKQMQQEGALIANHSLHHSHLLTRQNGESEQQWLTRVVTDILAAEDMLEEQLGTGHKYIAYPYGEYNLALKSALQEKGFTGFAQHSGAIASFSDFSALPRFASAGIYAELSSLKTKLNSLAMPVTDEHITDPELSYDQRRPTQKLTVRRDDLSLAQINCFLSGKPLPIETSPNQIILPLQNTLPEGRSRINCTAPSKSHKGRFYWYSQPWFVPTKTGKWLD